VGTPSGSWARDAWRVLVLLTLSLAGFASAGAKDARGVKTGLRRVQFDGLPTRRDCWLYLPSGYDKAKRYALVVVLHPAGLRGHRFAQIWGEVADRTGEFMVLAPECRDERKRIWKMGDEALVIGTLRRAFQVFPNIDSTRVLLTGFSLGANYAYLFGLRNPMAFRALAVASGVLKARPSPEADAILQRARRLPIYIVHGALDDNVPVERARASRDHLEKYGYRVYYRELPHLGHFYPPGESARIWAWFKAITTPPKVEKKD